MRYFVASSVIGALIVLAALTEYAKSRIRRRFRGEPTRILPTVKLPSFLPDEAAIPPSSAFDASRPVDDNLTVVLACARLYTQPVSPTPEPAPRTAEEHRLHFMRWLVRTGRLHEGDL